MTESAPFLLQYQKENDSKQQSTERTNFNSRCFALFAYKRQRLIEKPGGLFLFVHFQGVGEEVT